MSKFIAKTLVFKSLIAVLVLSVAVFSAPVSFEKALHVAENASKNKKLKLKHKSTHKKQRTQIVSEQTEEEPLLYVFQKDENKGFVLIAGDDVFSPIIGISENGTYDSLNMPPNFAWYLENIQEGMANALENGQTQIPKIANEWLAYADGNSYEPGTYLIQTKWGQGTPFNNETPLLGTTRTVTGCVATTMAQIMNYHQHPKNATGTIPAYITGTNKFEIEATELDEVVFDWENMKEEYGTGTFTSTEANAVATLMSVAGKSVEMDYSTSSGASSRKAASALKGYFGYDYATEYVSISSSDNSWISTLKEQVNLNLPVYYSGTDSNYGGHAFILDGYDKDDRFHVNWGWSGNYDGFYFISNSGSLNPSGYNFSSNQHAIINIKPRTDNSVPYNNSDIINLVLLEIENSGYIPITLTQTNGTQISNKTLNYDSKFIVNASTINNRFSTQAFYGKIAVVLEKEDGSDTEILAEKYVEIPIYSSSTSLPTEFYITKINSISGNYQISIKYTLDGQNYSDVPVTAGNYYAGGTNFIFTNSDYQPLKGITVIGPNLSNIKIKSQPTKSTYIHGEALDLSGMALTLEYENSMTKEVPFSDFGKYGITTNPINGTELKRSEHNNQSVKIIHNDSQISINTNNLTVNKAPITIAAITVTPPETGEIPNTKIKIPDDSNFTVGDVTWTPTADSVFQSNTIYTATVTLTTINDNYTFTGIEAATINDEYADILNNAGGEITLSYTFPETFVAVSNIEIESQPANLTYTHGETLDVSDLVVKLIYNDGTTLDVSFDDFEKYGITTDPENFTELDISVHSGKPITVIYDNDLNITASTVYYLTVNKASQNAPPVPTMASRTSTSITLNEISGAEYRLGAELEAWQDEVEFTNLESNTEYSFYARLKETSTHEASPVSETSEISTLPTYTVKFIDHDETELKVEDVEHGSSATAPEDPTRIGYTFAGWDSEFDEVTEHLIVTATYAIITCAADEELVGSECKPTSIQPQIASGSISVQPVNGGILLENLPSNTKVELYNLQGKQVYLGNSGNSQILQILIQTNGIYIVKVGSKTFKIVK